MESDTQKTTDGVREAPTATETMEREALEGLRGIITVLSDAGLNDEEIEILFNAAQEDGGANA